MARTIAEIKKDITNSFMGNEDVKRIYGLKSMVFENEFSKVSLEGLLFYIVATAIWSLEKLMDVFVGEQEEAFRKLHPHTLRWYTDKAKAYQHGDGFGLPPFEDVYDNANVEGARVNNSKIITYASAVSGTESNGSAFVKLKVAKMIDGNMSRLNNKDDEGVDDELTPFSAYMDQIKDAGVILKCESWDADRMTLKATVGVDPKQFYDDGTRIGVGTMDIQKAFIDYLTQLPFDGIYSKTKHMDFVQQVAGVLTVEIMSIDCKYGGGMQTPIVVDGYKPNSGWIKYVEEDKANSVPYGLDITYKTSVDDV